MGKEDREGEKEMEGGVERGRREWRGGRERGEGGERDEDIR